MDEEDKKKIEGLIGSLRVPNLSGPYTQQIGFTAKWEAYIRSIKWEAGNKLDRLAEEAVEKEDWETVEYLLKHDDFRAKSSAIGALRTAANNGKDIKPVVSTLIDKLMETLKDQRIDNVKDIIDILKVVGEHTSVLRAVPYLISIFKNNYVSREDAVIVLRKIGFDNISEFKDKLLALLILGRTDEIVTNGKAAVPDLIDVLEAEDWRVQRNAAHALRIIAEKKADKGDYASALKIIKELTLHFRKKYERRKDMNSLNDRRQELAPLEYYAQQIHDKMNPDKKKFHKPVKHQQVRTVKRKVKANG